MESEIISAAAFISFAVFFVIGLVLFGTEITDYPNA